ncbi:MAG TPA: serine/threonine protein kinase, partial [Oceanospirillales bacterium]|nr:serine/threonine protein kinase [Oceanospirillales bacterium]
MGNDKTQILKQAFDVYTTLSDLSVQEALARLQGMENLSDEVKQVVITLFSSQNQASQYVRDNFTPSESDFFYNNTKYQKGSLLGEYELLEKIGQGGMSQVFKAKRTGEQVQKFVAIKIFSPKNFSPHLLEHFINEQEILANLSHPNIVNMLHGDKTEDGNVYLVMELIEDALPITKYCQQHQVNNKQKIKFITQCAKTLAYSHTNLIIHRDLKPDNILINSKKQIKIVDFGIAKLISNDISGNKTTILALTPSYAAPEQINSENISVKTDVFSLAVVALELLTGKQVLPKDRLLKSCAQDEAAITTKIRQLKCDKDLKNILNQALAQNPDERYNSMQAFADDLANYLHSKPVNATSQSFVYRLAKFAKRRKALFVTSTAFLFLLIGGLIFTLWQNHKIQIESAKAQSVKQFMLDSFEVTDPDNSKGVDISVKDLLQSSYNKLENNKNIDKESKFDLIQTLAIAYGKLGQYNQAIDLLKKSLLIKPKDDLSLSYLAMYLFNADKL